MDLGQDRVMKRTTDFSWLKIAQIMSITKLNGDAHVGDFDNRELIRRNKLKMSRLVPYSSYRDVHGNECFHAFFTNKGILIC